MFNKIVELIDGENEDSTIFGMLRMIRFDIDPQESKTPFEKFIAVSKNIQDAKGNPGSIGTLVLSNLRIVWQLKVDNYINMAIGLESLISVQLKTIPVQWGNGFKHSLYIKAQSLSQTRYQFRFAGQGPEQLKMFEKIIEIKNKIKQTKQFRCTNLAVKCENQFVPLPGQDIKNTYNNFTFYEDRNSSPCKLYITNCRIVIIKENEKKMNMGIVWLMIRSAEIVEEDNGTGVRLFCRGLLASKFLMICHTKMTQIKKLEDQLKSFVEIYNKSPTLGFSIEESPKVMQESMTTQAEIEQLEGTRINLVRRKNAYNSSDGVGSIGNTEFNAELGLMMEKLPQGVTRADLWEILK